MQRTRSTISDTAILSGVGMVLLGVWLLAGVAVTLILAGLLSVGVGVWIELR